VSELKLPTALTGRQLKQSVKVFHNLKVVGKGHGADEKLSKQADQTVSFPRKVTKIEPKVMEVDGK